MGYLTEMSGSFRSPGNNLSQPWTLIEIIFKVGFGWEQPMERLSTHLTNKTVNSLFSSIVSLSGSRMLSSHDNEVGLFKEDAFLAVSRMMGARSRYELSFLHHHHAHNSGMVEYFLWPCNIRVLDKGD